MRRQRKRSTVLLALLGAFAVIAAACGSSGDDDGAAVDPGDTEETTERTGGVLTLAAEQWAPCTNPITGCSNLAWYRWALGGHVFPRLLDLDEDNNFVPSPLLDGEPEVTGEGTEAGPDDEPFTVTYHLNPDAVWEDGTPITSEDVRFTWLARVNTTGSVSTAGWEEIEDIDASDPQTAVITFQRPWASWEELGGGGGVSTHIFKASYFEQFEGETVDGTIVTGEDEETGEDIIEGGVVEDFSMEAPDINAFLNDSIPFSGGPFILQDWSLESLTLVPNENYWVEEQLPKVDQVDVLFRADAAGAIAAIQAGEIDAASPQPQVGLSEQAGDLGFLFEVAGTHEGLRPNVEPLGDFEDSPIRELEVREAILYAVDRQAIVDELIAPDFPGVGVNNCPDSTVVPVGGIWCQEDHQTFVDVEADPERAADILEDAGWELDGDVRVRDGQTLDIVLSTTADNQRREDTMLRVMEDLNAVGFNVTFAPEPAGQYFGVTTQNREFDLGMWAWVAGSDPSPRARYHSDEVPTPDNNFQGQGFVSFANDRVDELIDTQDELVVEDERAEALVEIYEILREELPVIPLFPMPNVTIFDEDRVVPNNDLLGTQDSSYGKLWDWEVIE